MADRLHRIEGHGGVGIAVRETGPQDAPPILFLHGWSQHSLCWRHQFAGPLAERFRLIAPDLRGHGASDKPGDATAYDNGSGWAGDIAALVAHCGAPPVVVGWSMGGWITGDYLRAHGDEALAGMVLVGVAARVGAKADPAVFGGRKADVRAEGLYGEDQAAEIVAAIAFARAMTAAPLSKRDLAFLVGLMMHCPPAVRRAARLRDEDWRDAFSAVRRPALILQGAAERVCLAPMAEELATAMPDAELRVMQGVGHMAFWERPAAFDEELARFASLAHGLA
ncbi:MAG: alpha/beta hydrolase [Pseudomonadota bacterium]